MWIKDLDVDQEYWQKQPEFTFYYNVLDIFLYYYFNFVKSYQTEPGEWFLWSSPDI